MPKFLKVYLNGDITGKRKIVEAEFLRENAKSIEVRLPDGNVILRKKSRDIVDETA